MENKDLILLNFKRAIWISIVSYLIIMLFHKCDGWGMNTDIATDTFSKNEIAKQKEIANNYKFQFDILEIENAKLIQEKDSLKAVAELAKNNYYQLKRTKPKYIENVIDCNDTLQAVYTFAVKKDSACNVAIQNLDNVIFTQDSIKDIDDAQKKLLLNSILVKDNLLRNEEKNTQNLTESVKNEKSKKNLWKTATLGAVIIIGKFVLFK